MVGNFTVFLLFIVGLVVGAAVGIAWISRNDLRALMKKNLCKEGYRLVRLGSHDPKTSIYRKIAWTGTF